MKKISKQQRQTNKLLRLCVEELRERVEALTDRIIVLEDELTLTDVIAEEMQKRIQQLEQRQPASGFTAAAPFADGWCSSVTSSRRPHHAES